jgi:DNA uptake protein ComE-like DNA-binding protein
MVIILVLWAIALLAIVASGVSFTIRQNLAIANIENDKIVAHYLARAGVERAIAEIMDDPRRVDSQIDTWYDDETEMGEVELAGGSFSVIHDGYEAVPNPWYGAGDESGKLNINTATKEQLLKLPDMTSAIAAAIIDWRDSNEEPEPDGIERGYYRSQPHPYTIRNGPFKTVRELLIVRGVTPELLFGEDANLNGLLDENENDGRESKPVDNGDGRLDRGWFAYLTVYSYEKNVNAAGEKRLNLKSADAGTIGRRLNLESWAAEAIVKARDEKKINHLVDLLDVRRDPDPAKRKNGEDDINFRSDSEKENAVTKSMFKNIVDEVTLKDDEYLVGRVNVNTAPLEVLRCLPGMDEELAGTIVRTREGDKSGFSSIADLLDQSGMTKEKFGKMEDFLTVRSNVFRIHSFGMAASGLARAWIECVVDRSSDVPRVLYWLESSP